jgi:hypothetical protein
MTTKPAILEGCSVLPAMEPIPPKRTRKGKAQSGRFATLNAFVDVSMRGLGGSAVMVWLILFRDTKPDGLARTSHADLARRAGVTVRTITTLRGELEQAGLIEVVRRGRLGKGASVYRVFPLEARFRSVPEESPQIPWKHTSIFPERDQTVHQDPVGSDAIKKKTPRSPGAGP